MIELEVALQIGADERGAQADMIEHGFFRVRP